MFLPPPRPVATTRGSQLKRRRPRPVAGRRTLDPLPSDDDGTGPFYQCGTGVVHAFPYDAQVVDIVFVVSHCAIAGIGQLEQLQAALEARLYVICDAQADAVNDPKDDADDDEEENALSPRNQNMYGPLRRLSRNVS